MKWRLTFNHFWARCKRLFYCLYKSLTTGRFIKPIDAHTYVNGQPKLIQITTDDGKVFWEDSSV